MEIRSLLGDHFCEVYHIENRGYPIEWINPVKLIVPERFDILAKTCFVEAYLSSEGMEWAEKLYRKHIQSLSGGRENGNEKKKTINAYVEIFKELIRDIKENGFDDQKSVVPVGDDNIIMDGAHRVSVAICLGIKLPIVRIPGLRSEYGYTFFQEHLLDEIYSDYMALEYIKKRDCAYSTCVWPRVGKSSELEQMETLMGREAKIVYKKKIYLDYNGLCNLMIQAYRDFEWIGRLESQFSGVTAQADLCYTLNSPLYYYVLEIDSLSHAKALKAKIRDIFKIGNYSIHMTDTQEEAVLIGKMLLNDSSINYLNAGLPFKDIEFYRQIDKVSRLILKDNMEDIAVSGDSVLAIYGLKNVKEIIMIGNRSRINMLSKKLPDIRITGKNTIGHMNIYNPENYFHYGNVKFLTPFALKKYTACSLEDINLINSITESVYRRSRKENIIREFQRHYRNYTRFAFEGIYKWLEKRNLLETAKKVYHFLKGR